VVTGHRHVVIRRWRKCKLEVRRLSGGGGDVTIVRGRRRSGAERGVERGDSGEAKWREL
jgi:hypothetical protein